ncbi:MAG: VOC family protein [Granulosicoccus sp.]
MSQKNQKAHLEHANLTVKDPLETAELFGRLFNWTIRWQGDAIHDGFSVHVGSDDTYLALYKGPTQSNATRSSHETRLGLNHLGVVVEDLTAAEHRVKQEGFATYSHASYEPGKRFYFKDRDGLEIEVIEYD